MMPTLPRYLVRCVWCAEPFSGQGYYAPTWGECDVCHAYWHLQHRIWPALQPLTPTFALETKVRYCPPVPSGTLAWQAQEPWRIIGRGVQQMMQMHDRVTYTIQPWHLTGHWMGHDRPLVVDEGAVTRWPDAP